MLYFVAVCSVLSNLSYCKQCFDVHAMTQVQHACCINLVNITIVPITNSLR